MRWMFLLLLASCGKPAQEVKQTSNHEFRVGVLFEVDGIRIYRFFDEGRAHYFASKGEVSWKERRVMSNNKTHTVYYYPNSIQTIEMTTPNTENTNEKRISTTGFTDEDRS